MDVNYSFEKKLYIPKKLILDSFPLHLPLHIHQAFYKNCFLGCKHATLHIGIIT